MQQTTHYSLKKPEENDYADIAALSEDMDIIDTTMYGKIDATEKGQADGVATLGSDGKIPAGQIPATAYDPAGSAAAVQGNLNTHIADAVKHITAQERTAWNAKADAAYSHIKTYSSFADLGLSGTEITPQQLFEALPENSILIANCSADVTLSDRPATTVYGYVFAFKPSIYSMSIQWNSPMGSEGEFGDLYQAEYRTLSTPSWTGWRKVKLLEAGQENDLKTFTALQQLGITLGQETIESVSQALPNGSMIDFVVGTASNQSIYPFSACGVTVKRMDANRVVWTAVEKSTGKLSAAVWSSDAGFSGWTTNTETVTGVYTGDGAESRTINLGFKPKAVMVCMDGVLMRSGQYYYGGLALDGHPVKRNDDTAVEIVSTGFAVHESNYVSANHSSSVYHYIAFK